MIKHLYIFNYPPHEKELCEMEFQQIFNQEMRGLYYFTHQEFDYTRSVFIKGRLDILDEAATIEEITHHIEENKFCYYDFKVIYIKNDITHVDYQESLQWCRDIAEPIDGSVNMKEPQVIFAITKINSIFYFGIYHNEALWNLQYEKPHSYSHSLNIRDARSIMNIAIGNNTKMKVVDPCCGVGTVVLEGLSMGVDIEGYDINRYVAYQARLNLEHFGYNPEIIKRSDIKDLKKNYDVTIMDIPYGVYSPFTYEQQLELLNSASLLSPKFVLISHIDMNKELENLSYRILNQCIIKKGNFKRYITLCLKMSSF